MNEVAPAEVEQEAAPIEAEDAAWAAIHTPLSVEALRLFCRDIERLYRINPMLEFKEWKSLGDDRYRFSGRNISQDPAMDFAVELTAKELDDGLQVDYANGLKSGTTFKIEPSPHGSKLTIIERYDGVSKEEREARLDEVDKSLVTWAKYLQEFLIMWRRWSRFGWWRWYMRRVWQPMKPSGRRITYMLLWISVVEVALIALGVAIYFIEYA